MTDEIDGECSVFTGTTRNFKSSLINNLEVISRSLVATEMLLAKLSLVEYLEDKISGIKQQSTPQDKVDKLLSILQDVPRQASQSIFTEFLAILRKTGQEHVANILQPTSDAHPMSDEHYKILVRKQQLVCQRLDPLNGVVDELVAQEVFTDTDRSRVTSKTGYEEMSREVVDILVHKPDSTFDVFITALCKTNQEHVASILGHESTTNPMSDEHRQLLTSKTGDLIQFIDPSLVLLSELVRVGILSRRDMNIVTSKSSYDEKSLCIVNILLRKSDSAYIKFLEALHYTDQSHVVHILAGEGESPLSRVRRLVLKKSRDKLIARVDTQHTSLVAKLISSGVLNDADTQRIQAQQTNADQTAMLLDVMARKSHLAYDAFLKALKESGHRKMAEELEGMEIKGLIDPCFRADISRELASKTVRILTATMEEVLVRGKGSAVNEISNLMEQNGFAISEISEGSIHISFRCFTEESLVNLKRLYTDKTLDKLFTQVFCPQFAEQGLESLILNITDDEFEKYVDTLGPMSVSPRKYLETMHAEGHITRLPVEHLELVLMRTLVKLFTVHYKSQYKSHEAIRLAYSSLAAVCYNWWQTMIGWPQSPTKHWFKHKLLRTLKYVCGPYRVSPRLHSSLSLPNAVCGVAHFDNKLFIICEQSNTIQVVGLNSSHESVISLKQLKNPINPTDIVSCTETRQLYVAGLSHGSRCVWRVSPDGRQVVKWLPNKSVLKPSQFSPWTLSVTSGRLLVSSRDRAELSVYGADGLEVKRVPLTAVTEVRHSVETPRGTFIVCHRRPQPRVSEVDVTGHVICVYNNLIQLGRPIYLSLDSDGRVLVVDYFTRLVVLLDSRLELERILLDRKHHGVLFRPWQLCYTEQTGQLTVCGSRESHMSAVDEMSGSVQLFIVR